MKQFNTLKVELGADGVAHLILNRPDRKNAISAEMMDELVAFAATAADTPEMRVVVLQGAEGVFCAGGDLSWMMAQIKADRAGRMAEARRLANMLKALNEMPVPLIGRVEGVAMGGGAGLACVCDLAIAADDCRFGFTETRLGIIPATISPYVLARIGEGAARQVMMNAELFEGPRAVELGLVARSVPAGQLGMAIKEAIAPYLKLPKEAVGRTKRLIRSLGAQIDASVIDGTIEQLADAWESDCAEKGIAAFLNKTPAPWAKG